MTLPFRDTDPASRKSAAVPGSVARIDWAIEQGDKYGLSPPERALLWLICHHAGPRVGGMCPKTRRQLARESGYSKVTANHALPRLERLGLIYKRQPVGGPARYVPGINYAALRLHPMQPPLGFGVRPVEDDDHPLSQGQPPLVSGARAYPCTLPDLYQTSTRSLSPLSPPRRAGGRRPRGRGEERGGSICLR